VLETPRAVQVVTEDVLRDRAILDPQEAIQNVSGVQRAGSRTGVGESYLVRGFRQQSLFKDGFRAGQLPASAAFTFEGPTDVANLERIEVLKGPSALLYGRGEPGGTVSYGTRRPSFSNRFGLRQQAGTDDLYRTEIHVDGVILPETLAARVDAAYQTNESFIDFVEGERFFVAPAVSGRLGEATTITFRGEFQNDDRSTTLALPIVDGRLPEGTPYDRYFGEPGFTEIVAETFRGLATLEHRWSEAHATTVSLHGVRVDAEGANFILFNFTGPLRDPETGEISRAAEIVDFAGEYFTARLDHVWRAALHDGGGSIPSVENELLASFDFNRQEIEGDRALSGHSPLDPREPRYTGYAPRPLLPGFPDVFFEDRFDRGEATSILLLDRVRIGERVIVSFGGRYEWFDAKSASTYSPPDLFPDSANDLDEETFNPSAGLLVKVLPSLSLYASYAESTFSFQNIAARTVDGDALDEERARAYEVGAKTELVDGRLLATAALFQIEKDDVAATDPENPFFSINGGEERSRGFEVDVAGEILPGWSVTASYAYVDSEITGDPNGVTTGNRRAGVPEHSGGAFTTYEIPRGPLRGLGAGGGVYASDRVEVDDFGSATLDGWKQFDAVAFYRRGPLTVQLNAKNLSDEEFFYPGSGDAEVQRAAARTILGTVRLDF
jgi:iron complex outermembrane recepter protein